MSERWDVRGMGGEEVGEWSGVIVRWCNRSRGFDGALYIQNLDIDDHTRPAFEIYAIGQLALASNCSTEGPVTRSYRACF